MAYAFQKRGRGKRWYVSYVDAHGKRVQRLSDKLTKTKAEDWARDLERSGTDERLTAAATPRATTETVAELLEWWLEAYSALTPSHPNTSSLVRRHLLTGELASMRLSEVTPGHVTRFLRSKRQEKSVRGAPLSLQTITHMRTHLLCAFTRALEEGRWTGENPVTKSKARDKRERKLRRLTDFLRVHEVEPLLAALDPRWRPLFATCIFLGLRKGEALALRKADVDRERRVLLVRRSWERDVTKNGAQAELPIPDAALPWLDEAAAASPSEFLFPHVCARSCPATCTRRGKMMRKDVPLQETLRRALARAGIVMGYIQKCRTRGCDHLEETRDAARTFCPRHRVLLWPVPQVRKLRFHDLRRTCASLLQMAGAPTLAASRLLRHSDVQFTDRIYTELEPSWLRAQVNRMPLQLGHLLSLSPDVDRMWTDAARETKALNAPEILEGDPGPLERAMRESNPRPLAPEANALSI
jgi:integrase